MCLLGLAPLEGSGPARWKTHIPGNQMDGLAFIFFAGSFKAVSNYWPT